MQTTISEWAFVQQQIDRNTHSRINWRELLGCSLTCRIYALKTKGYSSTHTFRIILSELSRDETILWDMDNIQYRLWISVCARFSEDKTRGMFPMHPMEHMEQVRNGTPAK